MDEEPRSGGDVNLPDENGYTPLHWACQEGRLEAARLLIQHGADISREDNDGFCPLEISSTKGHAKIVAMLISRGADVNRSRGGFTALNRKEKKDTHFT
jgi:ankyrin repeat protein